MPGGVEHVVRRSEIVKVERPSNSMMPDGLEAGLSSQEMADLLQFLSEAKGRGQ
jgi:putative heme-binding domain-containing protein